jgi:tetratricopeptide (TPR) repeat protein
MTVMLRRCAVLLVALPAISPAADDMLARYGHADMNISCAAEAQQPFTLGLLKLHSFAWQESRESFRAAAAADPDCAMAYWGIAMTYYDSLHEPPAPEHVETAVAALEQADAATAKTPRETAWIEAAKTVFAGYRDVPRIERDRRFSSALQGIMQRWPDDEEAAIFYALSRIALARRGEDPSLLHAAAAILEPLFDDLPGHPGVAHYLIHAYDDVGDRQPGIDAARRYARIAPSMTHAQHMPSHIFAGVGLWEESNASNLAALDADPRYYHALMYVVYGKLQLGQVGDAKALVDGLRSRVESPDGGRAERRGLHQVNTWLLLETRDWPAAAEAPMYSNRALDAGETIYVRGLGAAYTGRLDAAVDSVRSLDELLDNLDRVNDSGLASQVYLVEIQKLEIEAAIAAALGNDEDAVRLLREAAAIEDRPDLDRAPPDSGTGIPAHELLADLLLRINRIDEARAHYSAALARTPRRLHSMLGIARTSARANDVAVARQYYEAVLDMLANADDGHPAVAEASAYLENEPG